MYTSPLSNSFLILFVTFSQISFNFSTNSSFYIKKDIHLVSLKSLLYALISGRNIHKGLFFSIFVGNEIFKTFLLKKTIILLLDTTIILISIFFIETGLSCW